MSMAGQKAALLMSLFFTRFLVSEAAKILTITSFGERFCWKNPRYCKSVVCASMTEGRNNLEHQTCQFPTDYRLDGKKKSRELEGLEETLL